MKEKVDDRTMIVVRTTNLYILLTITSLVKPIPPQNWRQESATSRTRRPHLSLHIEASWVTSLVE